MTRRAAIVASGRSRDGRVTVRVEGMRRWRVEIAPDPAMRRRGEVDQGAAQWSAGQQGAGQCGEADVGAGQCEAEVRAGQRVTEAAVQEAAEAMLRDQMRQIRALKRTVWQPRGTADPRAPAES